MKKIFSSVLSILLTASLYAQVQECGTDQYMEQRFTEFPELESQIDEYMQRRAVSYSATEGDRDGAAIIPCVVHIIHAGGEGNISMEQIESAIEMLNEDFGLGNPDLADVRNTADAPFSPVAADVEITFELAKLDPDGECTNGVQRRYNPSAAFDANNNVKAWSTGGLDPWPCDEYMNIWVANTVTSSGGSALNGYAQFPYGGCNDTYGIVVRHPVFGNVGTAGGGRTLSHEMGHCLGLYHTFQGSCHTDNCLTNGDGVCDTPPVDAPQWSCATSQNTCTGIPSGDYYGFDAFDQFENLMSYSPCRMMFSQGQADFMNYNIAEISFLSNLISDENATNTGVGTEGVACVPQFLVDKNIICAGGTVTFTDESYHNITNWNWTFEGGTPTSSTSPNPTVTYNTGGAFNVTLEVSDGSSSVTETFEEYIFVLNDPGESLPYKEGFETMTEFPDNQTFLVENENGEDAWELTDEAVCFGEQCIKLNNYGNNDETHDAFISGPIDLSGVDPEDEIIFDFMFAYRKRFSANFEELKFFISNDCGETWSLRKFLKNDDLSPDNASAPYTPSSTEEWVQENVTNINSPYFVSNFMFKFEFKNDNGNNIYIDNINLYPASMTGLGKNDPLSNISIYPNPTAGSMSMVMDISDGGAYSVELTNLLGEKVMTLYEGDLSVGTNKLDFDLSELPKGSYMVQVNGEKECSSQIIVKQ